MAKVETVTQSCPRCGGSGKHTEIDHESLRAVREEAGVTLRAFAEQAGLSPAYISDVELGRRRATETVLPHYRRLES